MTSPLHTLVPAILLTATLMIGQPASSPKPADPQQPPVAQPLSGRDPATYVLGPGDDIVVRALDVEEIKEAPTRIDMQGDVKLPLLGKIRAAGLTAEDLESVLKGRLKKYVVDPDVTVSVLTYRSQPVMVLGAVGNPGVHQLEGSKTLFEVISSAGGIRAEAAHNIKITRQKEWGRIPLPGCMEDPTGQFYVAEVSIKSVLAADNPSENIFVKPRDVITVPKVQSVYVVGAVKKAGSYPLGDEQSMSVLQALALADGLERVASPANARIMRVSPGGSSRVEIPVDVKKIFDGKGTDVALGPDDILFIPTSGAKTAAFRASEGFLGIVGSAVLIGLR